MAVVGGVGDHDPTLLPCVPGGAVERALVVPVDADDAGAVSPDGLLTGQRGAAGQVDHAFAAEDLGAPRHGPAVVSRRGAAHRHPGDDLPKGAGPEPFRGEARSRLARRRRRPDPGPQDVEHRVRAPQGLEASEPEAEALVLVPEARHAGPIRQPGEGHERRRPVAGPRAHLFEGRLVGLQAQDAPQPVRVGAGLHGAVHQDRPGGRRDPLRARRGPPAPPSVLAARFALLHGVRPGSVRSRIAADRDRTGVPDLPDPPHRLPRRVRLRRGRPRPGVGPEPPGAPLRALGPGHGEAASEPEGGAIAVRFESGAGLSFTVFDRDLLTCSEECLPEVSTGSRCASVLSFGSPPRFGKVGAPPVLPLRLAGCYPIRLRRGPGPGAARRATISRCSLVSGSRAAGVVPSGPRSLSPRVRRRGRRCRPKPSAPDPTTTRASRAPHGLQAYPSFRKNVRPRGSSESSLPGRSLAPSRSSVQPRKTRVWGFIL